MSALNDLNAERSTRPWKLHAACSGLDAEMFYPPVEDEDEAVPAKRVCRVCPVREMCLEYALTARESEGVWGGHTARERRRIMRRRRNG